jgi:hypothetical protein
MVSNGERTRYDMLGDTSGKLDREVVCLYLPLQKPVFLILMLLEEDAGLVLAPQTLGLMPGQSSHLVSAEDYCAIWVGHSSGYCWGPGAQRTEI